MTLRVAVVGATGRLGRLVCQVIEAADDLELHASLDSSTPLADMIGADVVVDVTLPGISRSVVEFAIDHGIDVVVGTSGWSADRVESLATRLQDHDGVGVVIVPNFSIGSVLATRFATMAARFYDSVEIVETHHASKVDSPSGTAVRTAELMGLARAAQGPVIAPHTDQRARGQQVSSIPIHSLRLHGAVARQDVIFGGVGEQLTVSHETLSSTAYEAGIRIAVRAAPALRGLSVGLDSLIELDEPGARA